MIKGLYTTAAGMYPRNLDEEVAANNLANINTTGFKKDAGHFKKLLDSQLALAAQLGKNMSDEDVQEVLINFSQGTLAETNNPLDVAIQGDGFFVVQTPDGEKLTRDGHFQLDNTGNLVSSDGFPVMGSSGLISLMEGDVSINQRGEIYQDDVMIDQLKVVDFPRPYPMRKDGENLFSLTRNVKEKEVNEEVVVRQGFLEGSNVNPISEMIRLITISKTFQAGQKALQSQDRTLDKAVNSVGRV